MSNETPVAETSQFKIIEPKDGVPRIYAQYSNVTWTGSDVTVDLYKLEQPNREVPELKNAANLLLNTGRITMTWASVKLFHALIGNILARHEAVYGPINTEFKQI